MKGGEKDGCGVRRRGEGQGGGWVKGGEEEGWEGGGVRVREVEG